MADNPNAVIIMAITAHLSLWLIRISIPAVAVGSAWADPILKDEFGQSVRTVSVTCGGGPAPEFPLPDVSVLLYTMTDSAGNVFTMKCVNNTYFQGYVTTVDKGATTPFGRCEYVSGANILKYEMDSNNNYESIEWLNVNPMGATAADRMASQSKIVKALKTNFSESTEDWTIRSFKYLNDEGFTGDVARYYSFPFSPHDQTIGSFINGSLLNDAILTPAEALQAYQPSGNSARAFLQISPDMRSSGAGAQQVDESVVPEPDTWWLLTMGSLLGLRTRPSKAEGRSGRTPA